MLVVLKSTCSYSTEFCTRLVSSLTDADIVYWIETGLRLRLTLGLLLEDIFFHFYNKKPCQRRIWVRQGFVVETLGSHSHSGPERSVSAFRAALAWQFLSHDCGILNNTWLVTRTFFCKGDVFVQSTVIDSDMVWIHFLNLTLLLSIIKCLIFSELLLRKWIIHWNLMLIFVCVDIIWQTVLVLYLLLWDASQYGCLWQHWNLLESFFHLHWGWAWTFTV